ncbi:MAG: 3-deoxy-7-phosphoheptulonate synthase [Bacillota bacterium]
MVMAMGGNLLVARSAGQTREVPVAPGLAVGGGRPFIIADLGAVEGREEILAAARGLRGAGAHALRGGAPEARTSPYRSQGLGEEGLRLLAAAREATGLLVVAEVMDARELSLAAEYADVLQVGAEHMQNYSLLKALGRVSRPVLLARGPAATVEEWLLAAEYVLAGGNDRVILCEQGIRTFEPYTRSTLDLAAALAAKGLSHLPVLVDPSRGAGRRELVAPLARAALAAGLDGLVVEVSLAPAGAGQEGGPALDLPAFARLIRDLGLAPAAADPVAACGETAAGADSGAGSGPAPAPADSAPALSDPAPAPAVSGPAPATPVPAAGGEEGLEDLRRAIDGIDAQILELIRRRMELALEVGRRKARLGLAVYQPLRERALLEGLVSRALPPLSPALVREVWGVLLRHSRELQAQGADRGVAHG